MALSILNNISALTAQNQLSITQKSLQTTLTQLSSGLKINSGADDAAGLSIANGMQANIAALTQSAQNATNGTGMLQTADGALSQITNLLNRAVTLATEASNGGLNATQSTALNTEFQSILNEITSIGTTTTFNGAAIFKAGTTTNYNQAQASISGLPLTSSTGIVATNLKAQLGGGADKFSGLTDITGATTVGALITAVNAHTSTTHVAASLSTEGALVFTDTSNEATGSSDKLTVSGLTGETIGAPTIATDTATVGTTLTANTLINASSFSVKDGAGATTVETTAAMTSAKTIGELVAALQAKGLTASITGGTLTIQGATAIAVSGLNTYGFGTLANSTDNVSQVFQSDSTTAGQSVINTVLNQLDASHLNGVNLTTNNLSTTTAAQTALVQINNAIGAVAALRGNIGANINQLSAAANVMSTQSQNLKSAMSGITDADVATTVANMTKYNILQSTGMAALQQANQSQQSVLKLLQ